MNKNARQLIGRAMLIEGGLLGIALIWAYIQEIPWQGALAPAMVYWWIGIGAGLGLLGVNYLVIEYGSRYIQTFRILKHLIEEDVSPLFRNLPLGVVVLLALFSGIAEEFFFRGVLQSQTGLLFSNIIFGLAHIWKKTAILYGIYAAAIGMYFGGLYLVTGNLWVPVIAHIVNNFVAILYYMRSTALKSDIVSEKVL